MEFLQNQISTYWPLAQPPHTEGAVTPWTQKLLAVQGIYADAFGQKLPAAHSGCYVDLPAQ